MALARSVRGSSPPEEVSGCLGLVGRPADQTYLLPCVAVLFVIFETPLILTRFWKSTYELDLSEGTYLQAELDGGSIPIGACDGPASVQRRPLSQALRQNSAARRAQRCGCNRLAPWPTPATASILPFGSVLAKICCCAEAIGLLSPLSSKTGATIRGSSGTVSTSSKQSCIAAAISGGVRSISRTTQSHKSFSARAMSNR